MHTIVKASSATAIVQPYGVGLPRINEDPPSDCVTYPTLPSTANNVESQHLMTSFPLDRADDHLVKQRINTPFCSNREQ